MGGKALGLHHLWNGHVRVVPRDPRPAGSKDPSRNPRAQTSYTKKLGTGGPRGSSEPLGSRPHVRPGLHPQPRHPTSAPPPREVCMEGSGTKVSSPTSHVPHPTRRALPSSSVPYLPPPAAPCVSHLNLIRSAKGNATGPRSEGAQSAPAGPQHPASSAQPPSALLSVLPKLRPRLEARPSPQPTPADPGLGVLYLAYGPTARFSRRDGSAPGPRTPMSQIREDAVRLPEGRAGDRQCTPTPYCSGPECWLLLCPMAFLPRSAGK